MSEHFPIIDHIKQAHAAVVRSGAPKPTIIKAPSAVAEAFKVELDRTYPVWLPNLQGKPDTFFLLGMRFVVDDRLPPDTIIVGDDSLLEDGNP